MSQRKKIAAFWQEIANTVVSNALAIVHWDWKWFAPILLIAVAVWVPPTVFGWTVVGAINIPMGQ